MAGNDTVRLAAEEKEEEEKETERERERERERENGVFKSSATKFVGQEKG